MADSVNEIYAKIGARIREQRLKQNMSQADLSEKAHISLPHISNIELGKNIMSLDTFIQIVETLQVSSDLLLRPSVPEVTAIYSGELNELLADCTAEEIDSIITIVKQLKSTMHTKKKDFDF